MHSFYFVRGKNMKKKLFSYAMISAISSFASIDVNATPYMKLDFGYGIPNKLEDGDTGYPIANRPKSSLIGGIGFGYKSTDSLKFDVGYNYFGNMKYKASHEDLDNSERTLNYAQGFKSNLFSANAQYNFKTNSKLSPYVRGGVGLSQNKASALEIKNDLGKDIVQSYSKTKSNFAYALGTGIECKLNDKASINLGYQFHDLGKIQTSKKRVISEADEFAPSSKFRVNSFNLGLLYSFK